MDYLDENLFKKEEVIGINYLPKALVILEMLVDCIGKSKGDR